MNKAVILPMVAAMLMASCGNTPDYDATGIFEATTVTVSSETNGKILAFDVAEGDSVICGRHVATIDTTLLALQYKELASRQLSAEQTSPDIATQAASLRSQIQHQQGECDRIRRLLADGAATRKQSDDADARLRILRGELDALLSTLGKNRSSISENALALHYGKEQIKEQIAKSIIKSPITGTVLSKYAEAGEYVAPGRPLFKIADLDNIYLLSYFTASQLADLKIGREVTVIADFGGNKRFEYPGKVTWIASESEFTPKSIQTADSRANLVYAVKIAVKNDGRLKLGQYGEVRL